MSVTCYNSGRLGNIVFHQSMLLAYAKKWDLEYYIPPNADAYKAHQGHNKNPLGYIKSTGAYPFGAVQFTESNIHTNPSFQDIPKMDNVIFIGYYQSFLYFDWCRDYILEKFNFPYQMEKGMTSISVRRGDCINSPNFPIAPLEYYQNAVKYMQSKGFNKFRVHSDDILWCKAHFNQKNFPDTILEFSEGRKELENYILMQNCENNITARSTYSLTAAWFNKNPNKIVLVPTTRIPWWRGQNLNMLDGTGFTEIEFDKVEDSLEIERQY